MVKASEQSMVFSNTADGYFCDLIPRIEICLHVTGKFGAQGLAAADVVQVHHGFVTPLTGLLSG